MKTIIGKPTKNIAGMRFGRWSVIEYVGGNKWACQCECGVKRSVSGHNLRKGKTISCGCYSRFVTSLSSKTHGLTGCRTYRIWSQMKARCTKTTNHAFPDYGGRGIQFCDEWSEFVPFHKWALSNGYTDKLSLDRVDNNGNYSPDNCRWTTQKQQTRNTRVNKLFTINGITRCLAEWAEIYDIPQNTVAMRISAYGWDVEKAFAHPVGVPIQEKLIEFNGIRLTLTQWARRIGISKGTLATRLGRGWGIERAVTYVR